MRQGYFWVGPCGSHWYVRLSVSGRRRQEREGGREGGRDDVYSHYAHLLGALVNCAFVLGIAVEIVLSAAEDVLDWYKVRKRKEDWKEGGREGGREGPSTHTHLRLAFFSSFHSYL